PDDRFEDNDTPDRASDLGTIFGDRTIVGLQAHDDDWYHLRTVADGVSTFGVRIDFPATQGNLDLELYDARGALIGASRGAPGTEAVGFRARAAGNVLALVRAAAGAPASPVSYTMSAVRQFPDDNREDNDSLATAQYLGKPAGPTTYGDTRG